MECGLVQIDPMPQKIDTEDDYSRLNLDFYEIYLKDFRHSQYRKDIKRILQYTKSEGKILDIGCALGWFLEDAQKAGLQIYGVEPSYTQVEYARKSLPDAEIIEGEFSKDIFPDIKFDIITLWSVLEHMLSPVEELQKVHSKLKEGGLLAIRVPNYNSLLARLIIFAYKLSGGKIKEPVIALYQTQFDYLHFYHFTVETLSSILEDTGFTILEHYTSQGINKKELKARGDSVQESELSFLKNPIARLCIRTAMFIAELTKTEDEFVLIARKNNDR